MADASSRATVTVDNKPLRSVPGASMQMGGVKRVTKMDDQGNPYRTEEIVPSQIKCTMPHMADTDLPALRNFKDGSVHYTTSTGKNYTMPNGATEDVGELKNGEVEVTFGGGPMFES